MNSIHSFSNFSALGLLQVTRNNLAVKIVSGILKKAQGKIFENEKIQFIDLVILQFRFYENVGVAAVWK